MLFEYQDSQLNTLDCLSKKQFFPLLRLRMNMRLKFVVPLI
ncbi:hypothetical protein EMIT0373P_20425 [Pseudomonas chlororaphis]